MWVIFLSSLLPHISSRIAELIPLFNVLLFLELKLSPATCTHQGAEIGRIASKYVRVSLPAPPPTSPPQSPALTADKAEVVIEQAQPLRLDLSPSPLHHTTPSPQPTKPRFIAEPTSDKVEANADRQHYITTSVANMNHHHHTQQQQQKAGEQQLSEPEDMEMEGKAWP